MEYDPKDNEVIHLLKKLKDSNGAYPPEMLALRRQGYLKQVADISAGAGLAVALRNIAKGGKGAAGASSTAGTILEALLVIALVAEAGVVTYYSRDKIAEYFRSVTQSPKVEEATSPPVLPSPLVEMQVTPSPFASLTTTAVTVTETVTAGTPSATSSPVLVAETLQPKPKGTSGIGVQAVSTSAAGGNTAGGSTSGSAATPQDPNGNNGNHYGQTPIPARTKEQGNNIDSSSTQASSDTSNKKKP